MSENRSETVETAADSTETQDLFCDTNDASCDTAFVAFARIYSGILRKNQQLYVLGPKHDPAKILNSDLQVSDKITVHDLRPDQHITLATIKNLYLLMGQELIELEDASAGNVIGIGGLENHVLKSATLSSTVACPGFVDLHSSTVPIMRVALEPAHSREMPSLVRGMRLLNQADPCVQVFVQETGEHVLVSSGEVHLQRCIDDLKERFAKIEVNVSAPIVPFRETIIPPPKLDMVNEAIDVKSQQKKAPKAEENNEKEHENDGYIKLKTPNKLSCVHMHAKPLPSEITQLLEKNADLLKVIDQSYSSLHCDNNDTCLNSETFKAIAEFKAKLNDLFVKSGNEWRNAVDQIWSFGPRRCGPNILLNRIPSYSRPSIWTMKDPDFIPESPHFNYDSSFISGFQLASLCGPLCDEPMMGVCFIVEDWTFEKEVSSNTCEEIDTVSSDKQDISNSVLLDDPVLQTVSADAASIASSGPSSASSIPFGPFTGQIMSTVKEACRKAFQAQPQRLMAAMYSCNIQVRTE
ncbi:Elongation factor Tu GTP-binding domain-containing protein 1, partial [Stegodyphus mimosarum]